MLSQTNKKTATKEYDNESTRYDGSMKNNNERELESGSVSEIEQKFLKKKNKSIIQKYFKEDDPDSNFL